MKYNYEFSPQGHLNDTVNFDNGGELRTTLYALDTLPPQTERKQIVIDRVAGDLEREIGRVARGYRPSMHFAGDEAELIDDALNRLHDLPESAAQPNASHFIAHARFMIEHATVAGFAEEPVAGVVTAS